MVVPLLSPYLRWLQKGNPTGEVEVYPEIGEDGQSSLQGVYIVGDLTGVPLLKLASEGGARMVSTLLADPEFRASMRGSTVRHVGPARKVGASTEGASGSMEAAAAVGAGRGRGAEPGRGASYGVDGLENGSVHDVIIVGGGIAGVACALECERQGIDYLVLESSQLFHTIENFPKAKPILAKPDGHAIRSPLAILDGTKESLLADLRRQLDDVGRPLAVKVGARVDRIRRKRLSREGAENGEDGEVLALETGDGEYLARRVVLAIGKSGDARRLGVPGENAPHVFNRLFDAAEHQGEDILVVGGGDSAVEAAVALAESGNRVILSYRKSGLERPKEESRERFEAWVERGRIIPLFRSEVREIGTGEAALKSPEGMRTVKADKIFVLIGRELPLAFFRRSGIRMQGQRDMSWYVFLAALVSFFSMLYFGKAGVARDVFQGTEGILSQAAAYLVGPFQADIWPTLKWSAKGYAWYSSLNFLLGWAGSLTFLVSGAWSLSYLFRRRGRYFGTPWGRLKYGYFIAVGLFFTGVYFHYMLGRNSGWVEGPTYWYSLLYSVTIVLFGIRRVLVRKTRYIRWQILSLAFFQVFFLFLLPFHLFDPLIRAHFAPDSYVMREMFPSGKWSSFGYVLFWPLNMNDFGTSTFWTWFPLVQTFGILFAIVWLWGKGAYCGWICSCGGMAETLGDEYRAAAPHGPAPKRLEHIGQFVLAWAVGATALGYAVKAGWIGGHPLLADSVRGAYKLGIDVFFAGVLGLGVYFFLSGRVWCRFGCPLAALMHIYSRFSPYRILSEKKKCISCNICTKVCHMGIDVMGFANKGVPMNDVQCVRCSACVQSCPTQTLSFGSIGKPDPDNRTRREVPAYGKDDWRAGIL